MGTGSSYTSTVGYLSSSENAVDDYYKGWIIETVNPTGKFIIQDYTNSDNKITVIPSCYVTFSTSTTYTLKWVVNGYLQMGGNKILDTSSSS